MHTAPSNTLDARGLRIAVAVSRYHDTVTGLLRDGAVGCFGEAGGDPAELLIAAVPGAFDLTAVCTALVAHHRPDAVVALGCVITGETTHDQYIAAAVANGLTEITVRTGVPVTFGVLTCRSLEQARERAGGSHGNKGVEAMAAAIETANAIRSIRPATAEETV